MDSARHVINRILSSRSLSQMASYDVASAVHQLRILKPRSFGQMASYDVASTIHQDLPSEG